MLPDSAAQQPSDIAYPPELERLLVRLPSRVRCTFTAEQVRSLAEAIGSHSQMHSVKFQVSLPLFGKRFYLALFAGWERRSAERLLREGQLSQQKAFVLYGLALWLFLSVSAVGVLLLINLIRLALGPEVAHSELLFLPN